MLDNFKSRMQRLGDNQSSAYLHNANAALDLTFKRDPAYREVIVTHMPSGINREYYDAKFSIHTRRSIAGDFEDYYLQFRPFVDVPIGSYVDIPDDNGNLQTWLIVVKDDRPQFSMYYVLRCNWTLKWFINGKAYKVLGCLRNQNSYNSGLWQDNIFESVENQNKFWAPTTPYVQTIEYGQRFLINDTGRMLPIAWKCSKIEDVQPIGITRLTFTQEVAILDEDCGKYGLSNWCDVCPVHTTTKPESCENCQKIEPVYIDAGLELPTPELPHGKISYNGKDNSLRVGGSAKIFTASFWDEIQKVYVNRKPFWKLALKNGNTVVCSIDLYFDANQNDGDNVYLSWHVALSSDCPSGVILKPLQFDDVPATVGTQDGCTITCASSGIDIFKIHVEPTQDNINALVLRFNQLYNMVGKSLVVSAHDDQNQYTSETTMEVIS